MPYDIDTFFAQYVGTALWSELDDAGEPLDGLYSIDDIPSESLGAMLADCADFIVGAGSDLDDMEPGQAGHDFWLTRNGHGAGFWDRGLGDLGDRLTTLSKPYGSASLCVGDDGNVHYSG